MSKNRILSYCLAGFLLATLTPAIAMDHADHNNPQQNRPRKSQSLEVKKTSGKRKRPEDDEKVEHKVKKKQRTITKLPEKDDLLGDNSTQNNARKIQRNRPALRRTPANEYGAYDAPASEDQDFQNFLLQSIAETTPQKNGIFFIPPPQKQEVGSPIPIEEDTSSGSWSEDEYLQEALLQSIAETAPQQAEIVTNTPEKQEVSQPHTIKSIIVRLTLNGISDGTPFQHYLPSIKKNDLEHALSGQEVATWSDEMIQLILLMNQKNQGSEEFFPVPDEFPIIMRDRALSDDGSAHALCNLGLAYQEGTYGYQLSPKLAKHFFLQANAIKTYPLAAERLGMLYYAGAEGIGQDDEKAFEWLQKALPHKSFNRPDDYKSFIKHLPPVTLEFYKLSDALVSNIAAKLSAKYYVGADGITPDRKRAWEFYQHTGQYNNTPQPEAFIAAYCEYSSNQYEGRAYYELATMYRENNWTGGVLKLLKNAVEKGCTSAKLDYYDALHANILSRKKNVLASGNPVISESLVLELNQLAHRYTPAMYTLGMLYHEGNGGIAQDFQTAQIWFEAAARFNHAEAREMLRKFYPHSIVFQTS